MSIAANAGSTISYTKFANDAYKTKIKTAIAEAPIHWRAVGERSPFAIIQP